MMLYTQTVRLTLVRFVYHHAHMLNNQFYFYFMDSLNKHRTEAVLQPPTHIDLKLKQQKNPNLQCHMNLNNNKLNSDEIRLK